MMVFFSTAVASQSQGLVITFPEYGASNIAIDAKITIQVNEPFIFDTTSLPLEWTLDSAGDSRGKFWFVAQKYYNGTDSSLIVSSYLGGLGMVDSVTPNLREIFIVNIKEFYQNSSYGLNLSGIKLINAQTQEFFEIDSLILGLFTTVHEPIRFNGTSFEDYPLTCANNSFSVFFNESLASFETENGPIISMDTISMVVDTLNDSLNISYHPINSTLEFVTNNEIRVTLDNNFADSILYYLNVHLSRLTGDENDDISFSFRSSSVSTINVYGGPAEDLKPIYDTTYYLATGRKFTLLVPEKNEDYIFERWICPENPMIFQGLADTLPEVEIQLTCQNIRPNLNFIPLYTKIPYDTLQLTYPRNSTGAIIGSFQATNSLDSLNDSTYVFKPGTDFSLCYNCEDTIGFSGWIVNNDTTILSSKCVTQSSLNTIGLIGGGISTWIPVVREEPVQPCSTIVITIRLKGSPDLEAPSNICGFLPLLKIRHGENEIGVVNFIPDPQYPGDNKRAIATLELPNLDWSNISFGFSEAIAGTLPYQYEFLSCSYPQGSQSYGSYEMRQSLSRILEKEDPNNQYTRFDLTYIDQRKGCNHDFEITIRPRRVYLEVNEVMRWNDVVPNASMVSVHIYDEDNNKLKTYLPPFYQMKEDFIFNLDGSILLRQQIYEVQYNTILKLVPFYDANNGYNFYQWEPPNPTKKFLDNPISNEPFQNTLGPVALVKDVIVQAVFETGFRLESISYQLENGDWLNISTLNSISVTPTEKDEPRLMGLKANVGYLLPSQYAEGKGNSTGRIKFNFNRALDISNSDFSIIKIIETRLLNNNRLDGFTPKSFYPIIEGPNRNTYLITENGECKTIEMDIIDYDELQGVGYGLTPLDVISIEINSPEKIFSVGGDKLNGIFEAKLATRYPKWQLHLEKVKDIIHRHNHDWPFRGNDDAYGFLWLGHRNTPTDQFIGPPSTSDRKLALRIPLSSGFFNEDAEYYLNYDQVLDPLGSHSYIGMGWLFYDQDCGSWEERYNLLGSLINIVNEAAISTWAINWEIGAYLSVAAVILKIGRDLCSLDEDDFLGEGTFLAKPNASGGYWDCSPDYRVGPNYSGNAAYIPMYRWNYYKHRNSDIEFYYQTVLY